VTRRCAQGRFRLKPSPRRNRAFGYALARAAQATGVLVHAVCVMSNHYHVVATDPHAELPRLFRLLDAEVAKVLNALDGQEESLWKDGSYNAVFLDGPEVVVEKCAYALANPVAAGLVRHGRQWTGLWLLPDEHGTPLEFERPDWYFNPDGLTPPRANLRLHAPPGFESLSDFRERVLTRLAVHERLAADRIGRFVGRARLRKIRILDSPRERPPARALKPRFAARDTGRRVELARQLKAFLASYQEALEAWREGLRSVVFPLGTYWMRVHHGAACAGAG
jgi:REP element-mobilizing transposase RayT